VSHQTSYYGPGSGYHAFVGRDATRAFVTGCFQGAGLTHDLRGLTAKQMKSIDEWLDFYLTHKTYRFIGLADVPPIDPESPPPDDEACRKKKQPAAAAAAAAAAAPQASEQTAEKEL
jgi:hypothetical protein